MLANAVQAVESLAPNLVFVTLQTGTNVSFVESVIILSTDASLALRGTLCRIIGRQLRPGAVERVITAAASAAGRIAAFLRTG
jgi:hypothetical protein